MCGLTKSIAKCLKDQGLDLELKKLESKPIRKVKETRREVSLEGRKLTVIRRPR